MSLDRYHTELEELKAATVRMGELAVGMLEEAMAALRERDRERAERVDERKQELARMDTHIEQEALRLIALHQPMAVDMRTIACVLKVITYLTRVGRYGKDIAVVGREMAGEPHVARLVGMPDMADRVCDMVRDALRAFTEGDVSLLVDLAERDDDVDAIRYSIFREALTYMMEHPRYISRCAHYMMIARYLERCGDLACKIGEKVHYMVTGERVEIK